MKYLKRFNESSYEEIKVDMVNDIQWVEDSLLELTDVGYNVEVNPFQIKSDGYYNGRKGMTITIKGDKLLPISIGENLLTIDSYLREQGFVGFNPHDYDNEYSQIRYQVRVVAFLNNIRNEYENELSQFVKMLGRFTVNAPFNSISVSYFKPGKKLNENKIVRDDEVRLDIQDILLELEEYSIEYSIKDRNYYKDGINPHPSFEVNIKDAKDQFFRLEEIMDVLLRLEEYLKMTKFSIDIGIPNSDDYYPMNVFIEEFKGEELYHINLYIWRGFGITW
jgi:hypothetical protein